MGRGSRVKLGHILALGLVILLMSASLVYARTQGVHLQRSVIGSTAGGAVQGNGYTLNAVVGQPVVGPVSGAGYGVASGYPQAPVLPTWYTYLPMVLRITN
jgi:hypothetical protein